jgi:hypothetical protein
MGTILTGYLPAAVFIRRAVLSAPGSAVASQGKPTSGKEPHAGGKVEGLNAYKAAVLLAIGAAILSCL